MPRNKMPTHFRLKAAANSLQNHRKGKKNVERRSGRKSRKYEPREYFSSSFHVIGRVVS